MATNAKDAVRDAYKKYLDREAGATGAQYWEDTWNADYQQALDNNMTAAEAAAAATAKTEAHIGGSKEGKTFARTGIRREVFEGTDAYGDKEKTADWYTTNYTEEDPNEYATGSRDYDWASKLNTKNLENYTQGLNKMYGELQNNTLGQEGLEWWGYTKTAAIDHYMSDAGGDYSFDTASKLADFDIERDIKLNTGHQNYKKFGTIGYGNPLEIKTGTDDHGDITTEKRWLTLDPAANLNPTGTKIATQYQIDDDGEFVVDDDGNKIATGTTATPYSWEYVPDATAPGGYRITPVAFDTGVGEVGSDDRMSTVGHDFHMANYEADGMYPGGGGRKTFEIPDNVQNVDASRFTSTGSDKLDIGQWAETRGGKLSIAGDDYSDKNKGFLTTPDGMLWNQYEDIDHENYDSNLGLGEGEKLNIDWGGGYVTGLTGPTITTKVKPWVKPIVKQPIKKPTTRIPEASTMMMMGGGGDTFINLDQAQKSTTAADKAIKFEDRKIASGQGKKGFSTTKYKPKGNIRTLGIVS
tara:strand:+ start:103 stop:1677 length:1575 start_codon:yes stop_codon:yes gene_type:complete